MRARTTGTDVTRPAISVTGLLVPLVAGLLVASGAQSQTITIREEVSAESLLCDPEAEAPRCGAANPQEVERLVNAATQALILGDLAEADRFLTEALELDPCAVEATYLKGRIVAQREGQNEANEWFCRYLSLAPFGASASEARNRLEQAIENGAADDLSSAFATGVSRYRAGDLERADSAFTAVIDRHPVPDAYYNRAVVRLAMDRPAAARPDLVRYLQLNPDAEDTAMIDGALATGNWSPKSAAAAFFIGAFVPGGGQYYAGRTTYGAAVTTLVGGAVAAGLLVERTTIRCRAPEPDGTCPQDAIAARETERPLLAPALGVGAGILIITAIEAAIHVGGRGPPLTVALGGDGGAVLELAGTTAFSSGGLDIHLVLLRH